MRSLNKYIEECGEMAAPANTIGMGDVQLPDDVNPGVDGIPQKKKKKKKKKVAESLLDGEDVWMDRMDDQIRVLEWLAEHTQHKYSKEEAMRIFNKHIIFNADGSFDLPDSRTCIDEKFYKFIIDKELPDYVRFNKLGNRYNIFNITSKGRFKTVGFPKNFMSKMKLLGNCTIEAMNLETLEIAEGTCDNIDLFTINTKASDVWMDKNVIVLNLELNSSSPRTKNSSTQFHNIPFHAMNVGININSIEYLLKEHGVISWSTNLIK